MKYDYKKSSPLVLFLRHYRPHIGLFILDMICAIGIAGVDLLFPYISKLSMEKYLPQGMYKTFFSVMLILTCAYILRCVMCYILTYWGHRMGVFIEADMRDELYAHMQKLSFSFFDKNRTGTLMSRVTNDLFEITELAHHGPEDVVISAVTIIGAFIILCTIEWRLAVIVFALIPLFIVFTVILRKRMSDANMRVKVTTAGINAAIEAGFSGVRTAKAFTHEKYELEKFRASTDAFKDSKKEFYESMAIFHSGMEFALSMLSVVVITAGGYYIMGGSLDYIELITFSLYISTFITPIRKLVNFVEQYMAGMAGFRRFLELMRTEPDISDAPGAQTLENVRGDIEFNNVSFSYEGGAEVLKDISIKIKAGTCFAVVGPSGGGKTTLCQLVPRFYDVCEGSITVDGHDVRSITQRSLRQAIGIVQQDVFLFPGTIFDNIAYGKPDAQIGDVVEAAKKAEIHEEIMQMPDGYNSYVGERGVLLSGGQKQRIGIARVFLKNPPILILDEATSALDSVTEARIQGAFDALTQGRTSIIIAHRLSTIRGADTIAVIDGESIAEMGSHAQLLAKDGEYAQLYKAQIY